MIVLNASGTYLRVDRVLFIQGLMNVLCGIIRKYLSKKEVAYEIEDGFFMIFFYLLSKII